MKAITYLTLSLFLCFSLGCNNKPTEKSPMATDKWVSDLDYLVETLEARHINLYHTTSKSDIYNRVDSLKQQLKKLSENQITMEFSKIVRALDDSHTGIWSSNSNYYQSFTLGFFSFDDDGFRVLRTSKENTHLLGAKLVRIDDMTISEVIQRIEPMIQCADNYYSIQARLADELRYGERLHALGITKIENMATFEFFLPDSSVQKVNLQTVAAHEYEPLLTQSLELKDFQKPFSYKNASIGTEEIWFQTIDNHEIGYIYFSKYLNNLQMRRFAVAVSRELIKHNTQKLIIDVRYNGGGNFFNGLQLAKLLTITDNLDFENGIYVLTSRYTYSAGMSNTAHFKELLNAKLVGEPTGANPNDYQDADGFPLPHSQMWVQYSKRYYRFQDSISNGIIPDVHIKPKWSDYQQEHDEVLAWVLKDIRL